MNQEPPRYRASIWPESKAPQSNEITAKEKEAEQGAESISTGQGGSLIQRWGREYEALLADSWFPEFACWLFSLASLLAILLILQIYDGRPLPGFPYDITVGTFVAFFTTLSTTALMEPVSQGISQLKWLWFYDQPKRLADLETIDQASRGFWGSIVLLLSSARCKVSSIGALITLLVLVSNAITQQSISYVTVQIRDNDDSAALAPRSYFFGSFSRLIRSPELYPGRKDKLIPDGRTEAAFLTGLLHDQSKLSFARPHCLTGNCTWPAYRTLAVCSAVTDLSDLVTAVPDSKNRYFTRALLPGVYNNTFTGFLNHFYMRSVGQKLEMNNPTQQVRASKGETHSKENIGSLAYRHLANSTIADFFVVRYQNEKPESGDPSSRTIIAAEVNLHFCVSKLKVHVKDGVRRITKVGDPITSFTLDSGSGHPAPYHINATVLSPSLSEQFQVSNTARMALLDYSRTLFHGFKWQYKHSKYMGQDGGIGVRPVYDALQRAAPDLLGGLEDFADNVATSLSNRIITDESHGTTPVVGTAYRTETQVKVSWGWTVLLDVLVAASLFFLLLVRRMCRQRGSRLWRTSNLALLQALDTQNRPSGTKGVRSVADMGQHARTVHVKMMRHDDGWMLSPV